MHWLFGGKNTCRPAAAQPPLSRRLAAAQPLPSYHPAAARLSLAAAHCHQAAPMMTSISYLLNRALYTISVTLRVSQSISDISEVYQN